MTEPTCRTCLQVCRDGRCRIGHKERPEPCREYLRDRKKKRQLKEQPCQPQ